VINEKPGFRHGFFMFCGCNAFSYFCRSVWVPAFAGMMVSKQARKYSQRFSTTALRTVIPAKAGTHAEHQKP